MKKAFLLLVIGILSMNVVCAQNWEKYKAEDLQFVAYYPKEPKRSVQKIPTSNGELDMHMILYAPTTGDDNRVYLIICSDYPKEQFKNADAAYNNLVLTNAVNKAVSSVKGELIYNNKIKFNGYPARSVKVKMQGAFMYLNAYLVENTMFITQVICLTEKDENASIQRFIDSFEIIKTK
ncbi:MAG: hypothetical protein AAF617_00935 [Bacteroidota bacterium]